MSHTKGQRIERELVHLHQDAGIPATGVPLSGAAGAAQPTRVTTSQDPWCGSSAWREVVSSTLVITHPRQMPSSACTLSASHDSTHFGAQSRGLPSRYPRLRTAPYGEARGFATDLLARR